MDPMDAMPGDALGSLGPILAPGPGEARVVVVPLDSGIAVPLKGFLSKHERVQCHRYQRPSDRGAAAVMRGLWRLGAAALTRTHPALVGIERDRLGRPAIAGQTAPGFDLNVSRTGSCCALIVADGARCGIDIQQVEPELVTSDLVEMVSQDPDEARRLLGDPEAFFRYWVAIESALKADGRGLSDGLESVRIISDRVSIERSGRTCLRIGPKTWVSGPIRTPSGVVGASASDHGGLDITQITESELAALWF